MAVFFCELFANLMASTDIMLKNAKRGTLTIFYCRNLQGSVLFIYYDFLLFSDINKLTNFSNDEYAKTNLIPGINQIKDFHIDPRKAN